MSCCESGLESKPPRSFNASWLVKSVFWVTNKLFHSFYPKGSERRHQHVMRLFQFCADRQHLTACSMYGHILLFRGVTQWDKQQGIQYLKCAAKQGDIKASYQLAELMMKEEFGLSSNPDDYIPLLITASNGGHALAEQTLCALRSDNPDLSKRLS